MPFILAADSGKRPRQITRERIGVITGLRVHPAGWNATAGFESRQDGNVRMGNFSGVAATQVEALQRFGPTRRGPVGVIPSSPHPFFQRECIPFLARLRDFGNQRVHFLSRRPSPGHVRASGRFFASVQRCKPVVQLFSGQLGREWELPRAARWLSDQVADLETRDTRPQNQIVVADPGPLDILLPRRDGVGISPQPAAVLASWRKLRPQNSCFGKLPGRG